MASVKNYGLAGTSGDLQLGPAGGRLLFSAGMFRFVESDGSTLNELKGAAATESDSYVVKSQLDLKIAALFEDTAPQLGASLDVNGFSVVSTSAGDIAITPDTTGEVVIDGLKWPQADGTTDYVLKTDGAGQLSWVANAGGGGNLDDLGDVVITAATTGDLIRYNGANWVDYPDSNFASSAQGDLADTALQDVSEDNNPVLGGDLDVGGNSIISASAGDIAITPDTSGNIMLDGQTWPNANAGTNGYVLSSTTSGVLSWVVQSGGGGLTDIVDDLSPQLGDDLDVNGFSIVSVSAGDIVIAPDTGGSVVLGQSGAGVLATSAGEDLYLTPGTTGDLILDGLKWPQADGTTDYVLKTDGAGQLSWTAVAADVFADKSPQLGADLDVNGFSIVSVSTGDISITPDTSGNIILDGQTWPNANAGVDGYMLSSTTGGTLSWIEVTTDLVDDLSPQLGADLDVNGQEITSEVDTDIVLTAGVGGAVVLGQAGTATLSTDVGEDLYLSPGVGGAVVLGQSGPGLLSTSIGEDLLIVPGIGGSVVLGQSGAGVLATDDGEDLYLTPGTTGDLILDGLKWPQADGTTDYVLKTDGAGQLSWTAVAADVFADKSPQLGADLDVNGFSIVSVSTGDISITPDTSGNILLDGQTWPNANAGTNGYVLSSTTGGVLSWVVQSGGISEVYEDTTPVLGGDLDVGGNDIISAAATDINITPGSGGSVVLGSTGAASLTTAPAEDLIITPGTTGDLILDGLKWPQADGTNTYVLQTDGSTQLSWVANAGGGGLTDVFDDKSPQLGADLDVNGFSIVSVSAGDIVIAPDTTGDVVIDGLKWPQADGTTDYVLKTNGSGQLSWVAQSGGSVALNDISDVTITAADTGDILRYSGSAWVDYPDSNFATSSHDHDTDYLDIQYKEMPQVVKDEAYTFALSDSAKSYYHTSGSTHTWTIPPNSSVAFELGTVLTMINNTAGGAVTLARGSGVALIEAGVGTDQDVTLAASAMATIIKVDTNRWFISGVGI